VKARHKRHKLSSTIKLGRNAETCFHKFAAAQPEN
jgi:hypothetical protein